MTGAGNGIVALVLAGGLSRRMGGGDKCLRPLAGRPMLAHVLERLSDQVGDIVINANGDAERFAPFGRTVIADPIEGFAGPLVGVLAGLEWTRTDRPTASHIVSVPSDAPFLPRDLVAALQSRLDGRTERVVLARSGGRVHPVVGLWPVALAGDLRSALEAGIRKVLDWTDRHDTTAVDFAPTRIGAIDIDPFFNANTPEELAEAEALIGGGATS
ncbi:MAG: molybdenum cofactor guanylyltransferase MobA [Rhizobiales bacterium]|nr:molybdenum cofactor guanylyltransferase MobA [Hyphomicrobiales bacterium]